MITLTLNDQEITADEGTTVASAILASGESVFKRSVTGEPRGPLCGMGICFECRVTIDGEPHQRSCTVLARDGMEVTTGD